MRMLWLTAGLVMLVTSASAEEAEKAPAAVAVPAAAQAKSVNIAPEPNNCAMTENVTLNVNFNLQTSSFEEARQKFEKKMQQIDEFAKQQQLKKFDLQSLNYGISQNNYGNGGDPVYQMNGNASYQLDSADAAFKMATFLQQQKFSVSVNVNKYRNGRCNHNHIMMEE